MQGIISLKTLEQQSEWLDKKLNEKLRGIVIAIGNISYYVFNKPLIITEVYRTQKTQNSYYKNNPAYIQKPWNSVHQYYRGVDIRTNNHYTELQISILINIANSIPYDIDRPGKKTGLYHNIGKGNHLHLQTA